MDDSDSEENISANTTEIIFGKSKPQPSIKNSTIVNTLNQTDKTSEIILNKLNNAKSEDDPLIDNYDERLQEAWKKLTNSLNTPIINIILLVILLKALSLIF